MGNKQISHKQLEDEKELAIHIFRQYFNEHPNIMKTWREEGKSKCFCGLANKLGKLVLNEDNLFISPKYFAKKAREILNEKCQTISNYSDMKLSSLMINVAYNKI